ncbi:hypothetical protein BKP45_15260 [Anaerobacillus alkalidiazotrophicus]|uniref:Uncharacterized protein n=1 Tax=Anaerobacillus alkalidiazotrophicus TaxID=472963 RepID=A0A1S2M2S6_9BACI|nr:hypothetical protein [Anaerobacillus alkalidiazotrophicus]OIJ18886.1 hypothetical protein BKP45_15260 [Anaerobacillus alkalidiazotrophicus]
MKKLVSLISLVCIIIFIYWLTALLNTEPVIKNNQQEDAYTVDFFLTHDDGAPIKFASPLELNDKEEVIFQINLNHNISETRNYALVILEDYIQRDFLVEDNEELMNVFIFKADKNSSNQFLITKTISPETRELSVLVIKKPNYVLKEFDLTRAVVLEEIFSSRHPILQERVIIDDAPLYNPEPDFIKTDKNPLGLLFLSSELDRLQTTLVSKIHQKLYLSVANNSRLEQLDFVLIGLKDWEQYEFINGEKVLYTNFLSERQRKIYEIETPNVEKDTNIQFIAFPLPLPFKPDNEQHLSYQAIGTFRLAVEP